MFDIANSSQICQTSEPEEELPSKHISVHMNLKGLYYILSNPSFWYMPSSGHCSYFAFLITTYQIKIMQLNFIPCLLLKRLPLYVTDHTSSLELTDLSIHLLMDI